VAVGALQEVYGFSMEPIRSTLRQAATGKALVMEVKPKHIVSVPVLLQVRCSHHLPTHAPDTPPKAPPPINTFAIFRGLWGLPVPLVRSAGMRGTSCSAPGRVHLLGSFVWPSSPEVQSYCWRGVTSAGVWWE
jgi:hypothetical protein